MCGEEWREGQNGRVRECVDSPHSRLEFASHSVSVGCSSPSAVFEPGEGGPELLFQKPRQVAG